MWNLWEYFRRVSLTSQCCLEVDFGLAVEVFHAGRPAARQEDVLLLVPRRRVVDCPFALLVKVGNGCGDREGRSVHSCMSVVCVCVCARQRGLPAAISFRAGKTEV